MPIVLRSLNIPSELPMGSEQEANVTTRENGSLDTPEERRLAGRLAGVLFLSAAVGVLTIPLLPGGGTDHWPWLIAHRRRLHDLGRALPLGDSLRERAAGCVLGPGPAGAGEHRGW